ncbi:MAG: ParB/RepB/Spo0J family partition protein [Bacteroidota bacterium]|nr:ParB/RepB/Spo0J family partition protein [Bacteroidota bacterium]
MEVSILSNRLFIDLSKAGTSHLPEGAERCAYKVPSDYGVIYIPINRLKQVYQTDKATNKQKVRELVKKMKEQEPINPVEIGYAYDIQDGHHRFEATLELGYTHVPCKVVGTDPEKIKEAKSKYREVWKSVDTPEWFKSLFMVLDLNKAHQLHKEHLVRRAVQVRGRNGKVFTRMQWVDPNTGKPVANGKSAEQEEPKKNHAPESSPDDSRINWDNFDDDWDDDKSTDDNEDYSEDEDIYNEDEDEDNPDEDEDDSETDEDKDVYEEDNEPEPEPTPPTRKQNNELGKDDKGRTKSVLDMLDDDDEDEDEQLPSSNQPSNKGKVSTIVSNSNLDMFDNVIKKQYSRGYIMQSAVQQGITWQRIGKDGNMLPHEMDWMRAVNAIRDFIKMGGVFQISPNEKNINENMKEKNKSSLEKYFLKFMSTFNGSKQLAMEWARSHDYGWKEVTDPLANWARFTAHIKHQLAKGKMVNGVRTQQKEHMERANAIITPDIKDKVKNLGIDYGKKTVMSRAEQYGINWRKTDKKGNPLPFNMEWMRAASEIQLWIAQGHEFGMEGEVNKNKNSASTQITDVALSKYQKHALDFVDRNSQNYEKESQTWSIKALMIDNDGMDEGQAMARYQEFVNGAKNAKIMLHFDPFEKLPGNITAIDRMSTDGYMRNPYQLGTIDKEAQEISEREIYGEGFDEAEPRERPIYACMDLFNRGLSSNKYGEVALVLKDNLKDRSTVLMTDSNNLPYETNGKLTRRATSAHHSIVDMWTSKWKQPKKADKVRKRVMDAICDGKSTNDEGFFETQVLGGVDFKRDVDHILVPKHWTSSTEHIDKHKKVQEFAKLHGLQVKYQ